METADFLAHLSRRLEWAIVIAHLCRPSVRPSSIVIRKLSHFQLLLWKRNATKLDTIQDLNVLYQVCLFQADRKNKLAAPTSAWLRHFDFFSETRNRIQRNLTGSKISTSSTKFVFFRQVGKKRWPPWPLIGWDIFYFFSEAAERNSTKLDRKEDLNVLYQVCVFRADRKNKMAALASDWLRHFRLLLWNCWTEFEETWQEARSQRLLPSSCFWGWSEKQVGRPSLCFAETFSTSSLKPLNRIQWNLTGSKISTSFTKSVFFGPIGKKKDGHHGPWLAETFLTSPLKLLNGIQRNLTGSKISTSSTKLCFSVWWVNRNYRPGRSVKKVAHCTLVHNMWPFWPLVYVFI